MVNEYVNAAGQAVPISPTVPLPTTSNDYTTEPAGTAAPLLLGVQGGGVGSLPISQPDAGNRADGNGTGTCAATCVNTSFMAVGDTSSFGGGQTSLHVTAFSGSATIVPQDSDDNVNFVTAAHCWQSNAGDLTIAAVTAVGTYVCNIEKRYFRWQYTVYGSGTQTGFWVNRHGPYFPAPAITPIVSAAGESSHVLKASAGNLYSIYATNLTATAGFLVVLNSTTAPGDGAITPLECIPLPGNSAVSINYTAPSARFSTGITAVVTSAATCFTKTTGVITAFFKGAIQ